MSDGLATLDDWIARLRKLPDLARDAAPEVADVVREELTANIAAGRDPNGKAWPKTQDGRTALADAAKSLTVTPVGDVVIARLSGPAARHHLGAVRGGIRRQILPTTKLPGTLAFALARVFGNAFRHLMGGGT